MLPTRPRAVLFDLDGTLADTAADLCAAANAMRAEYGLAAMALDQFRPWVSRGGRAMLDVALAHLPEAQRAGLLEDFLQRYAAAPGVHTRMFAGIEALLTLLDAERLPWGIVTNKPIHLAEPVVAALGLAARCGVLLGGDSLPARKPDPLPLRVACERLGVPTEQAVYLGDDRRDVDAARAAPMPSVAAAWGYIAPGEDLRDWGADVIARHPDELPQLLRLARA